MSSQVVRVQGFSKGSLSSVGNESERGNVNHRNPDIDRERTHLNLSFKETEHGFYDSWKNIVKDLNVQYRDKKGAVAFEGMVITAERKFFEERFGWEPGKSMSSELVKFWKESYDWAVKEVGYQGTDKNILSAVVHADETSLHLQMYYLPVTEVWKEKVYEKGEDGKILRSETGCPIQKKENGKTVFNYVEDSTAPKLSRTEFWRARGGNTSYGRMQDRFHEEIGGRYGLERGEIGSNKEHRTKAQWEAEQLHKKVENVSTELKAVNVDLVVATKKKKGLKKDIESLEIEKEQSIASASKEIKALKDDIKALEGEKERLLTSNEVKALQGKKTLLGGLTGVSYKDYEALVRTAEKVDDMTKEVAAANTRADAAEQKVKDAYADVKKAYADMDKAIDRSVNLKLGVFQNQIEVQKAEAAAMVAEAKAKLDVANNSYEAFQQRTEIRNAKATIAKQENAIEYLQDVIRERLPEISPQVESKTKSLLSHSENVRIK